MPAKTAADRFLITCEHGGNRIPAPYRFLFHGKTRLLRSHRGFDPGALLMARVLARRLGASLVASDVTRLLVDLNRSPSHRDLFSEITQRASAAVRKEIIERYYLPYRSEAEKRVSASAARGYRLIHLSSHSFTPQLKGRLRSADVGLLYDPRRRPESELCARWKASLRLRAPRLRVKRNYPYKGNSDGLTSYFRKRYPAERYIGIELELNQRYSRRPARDWLSLRSVVADALRDALRALPHS